MNSLPSLLGYVVVQLPIIIVWIVGIILSIVRWKKNPKVYLYTVIAIGLLMFNSLVGIIMSLLPMWYGYGSINDYASTMMIRNVISEIIRCVAWGLLLTAIFRKENG